MKLVVDKTPPGTKSPNIGDAVMMAYWPMPVRRPFVISDDVLAKSAQPVRRRKSL
jgi:hypothetical protein